MRRMLLATFIALPLMACGGQSASAAPSTAPPSPGVLAQNTPAALPAFSHVVVLVLENHSLDDLAGSPAAPNFNALMQEGAVLPNYYAVSHPSEPNYLALIGGDVFGVADDAVHQIAAPTLVDELEANGHSWKGYFEGLGSGGPLADAARTGYAQRHNPFMSFTGILSSPARLQNVQSFVDLQRDLAAGTLPDFSFLAPNLCHDMHDCAPAEADPFLGQLVNQIQASPSWDSHSALFVVFDEDDDADSASSCCGLDPGGGQVGAVIVSPMVKPGSSSTTAYNHYSLLRTVEDAWGLAPLGHSADPAIQPIANIFSA